MVACAVATCRLRPKSKKFVSFYQFPKDEKLKRMWVEACKRKDLKVKDIKPGHRICSMHFTADCFNYHLTYDNVKLLLKPMSCPTLNLPRLHSSTRNSISYEDHIEKLIPVQDFMRREVTFTNEPGSDILSVTSSNERSISHCDTLDGAKVQSTSPFVTPDGAQGLSTSHSHQEDHCGNSFTIGQSPTLGSSTPSPKQDITYQPVSGTSLLFERSQVEITLKEDENSFPVLASTSLVQNRGTAMKTSTPLKNTVGATVNKCKPGLSSTAKKYKPSGSESWQMRFIELLKDAQKNSENNLPKAKNKFTEFADFIAQELEELEDPVLQKETTFKIHSVLYEAAKRKGK